MIKHHDLPAQEIAERVNIALREHNTLVITAPPGAGKSTLLPLTMLEGMTEGKILMLEPRRLAARQIAERMAWMLGEEVGETVGYRIRFEKKIGTRTRIEVITEGILTRMLIDDPTLEGVGTIIFDEFHERSLTSDVALALARESQAILREDLRIVLMSATIDTEALCKELQAPVIESKGRMFDVDVRYTDDLPWQDMREALTTIAQTILRAHREHEGDILVFLPGEAEILRIEEMLQGALGETHICPLYGMLDSARQRQAIAPSRAGERKVVLATPIAETSLTIEGVRVVVDAGRCRKMVFDTRTGLSRMTTVPISMDMARQRAGRAGRVAEGVCYRLWSKASEMRMTECRTPEIEEADLAPMLLDIAAWGEAHPEQLPWLTPPPHRHVLQGQALLRLLNAIDAEGVITPNGRALASLPCHPRIAQLLVGTQNDTQRRMAADIAALLEAATLPLKNAGADINVYLEELRRNRRSNAWSRIAQAAEYYYQLVSARGTQHYSTPGAMIAAAYPERIAQRQADGYCQYRLANGETATMDSNDVLSAHEWIAIAHMNGAGGRIFLASPVTKEELSAHVTTRDNFSWDNKSGQLVARQEQRIGNLLLSSKPIALSDREAVHRVLCEAAHKWGTSMLNFDEEVLSLQRRVAQVAEWHPEMGLPDLSTEAVLARTEEWLPFYLGNATSTTELKKICLTEALWGLLEYDQQQAVDRLAPSHLTMPSGRRIRVEYRQGAEFPIVRARLQECFGMTDTPRVDDGERPVLMELLSPGFKPVQLTSDLQSFWSTTYFEVRKELKRRYPKHAWPENPNEKG